MKSFHQTIREMRESRGLLLRQLAAKLDVDPSLLSRVENGTKQLTRDKVVTLATVLGEDQEKLLVLYLSERVVYELKDEENLAIEALMVAEKRIRYGVKNPKTQGGGATDIIN